MRLFVTLLSLLAVQAVLAAGVGLSASTSSAPADVAGATSAVVDGHRTVPAASVAVQSPAKTVKKTPIGGVAAKSGKDAAAEPSVTAVDAPVPASDGSGAIPVPVDRTESEPVPIADDDDSAGDGGLGSFCGRIDVKLSSIGYEECLGIGLIDSGAVSNDDTPLFYRDFVPAKGEPVARVLLIGGIHGDEYSSVSVVFKWLGILQQDLGENFHWRIVPVANPDGLLRPPRMSQRMNANGVDLNRNFPTPNWDAEAHDYWVNRTRRNKRRYPGPAALSEPESAWLAAQIDAFQPHAVISVHAPHGVVDFDGPRLPPRQLGPLELRLLGTYPGSMGRYIGIHKGIPILTVELESAFGMPRRGELLDIWYDMLGWLHEKIATPMQLAKEASLAAPPAQLMRVGGDPDNDG